MLKPVQLHLPFDRDEAEYELSMLKLKYIKAVESNLRHLQSIRELEASIDSMERMIGEPLVEETLE